jgi:hypothetical protein
MILVRMREALEELILASLSGAEFRRWMRSVDPRKDLSKDLPGDGVSDNELVSQGIDLLLRRNLISGPLFDSLARALPTKAAAIADVAVICKVAWTPLSADRGPVGRAEGTKIPAVVYVLGGVVLSAGLAGLGLSVMNFLREPPGDESPPAEVPPPIVTRESSPTTGDAPLRPPIEELTPVPPKEPKTSRSDDPKRPVKGPEKPTLTPIAPAPAPVAPLSDSTALDTALDELAQRCIADFSAVTLTISSTGVGVNVSPTPSELESPGLCIYDRLVDEKTRFHGLLEALHWERLQVEFTRKGAEIATYQRSATAP